MSRHIRTPPAKTAVKLVASLAICLVLSACSYTLQSIKRVITPNSSAQVSEEVRKAGTGSLVQTPAEPKTVSTARPPSAKPKAAVAVKPAAKPKAKTVAPKQAKPKPAAPQLAKPKPVALALGRVAGKVDIRGKDKRPVSAEGLILRLSRVDGESIRQASASKTHLIDMQEKKYLPGYMSINTGDKLTFVNNDTIKHNVFSSTGNNAFDLGTYDGGLERDVSLHEAGLVKVYCNIHRNMAMFVSVDDQGRSMPANKDGSFVFEDLPAGDYNLELWHLRGKKTVQVSVLANKETLLAEVLDTESFQYAPHKNKFGSEYGLQNSSYRYGKKEKPLLDDEHF